MTDPKPAAAEAPHFETDEVEANLAIEQGLGIGARELAAQREPGDDVADHEDAETSAEAEQRSSTNDA